MGYSINMYMTIFYKSTEILNLQSRTSIFPETPKFHECLIKRTKKEERNQSRIRINVNVGMASYSVEIMSI
jgi:hypothetical protein